MNKDTAWHMIDYLSFIDALALAKTEKWMNGIVQEFVKISPQQIYQLRRRFRFWKHNRRRITRKRYTNSWSRRHHDPNDRVIF